MNKQGYLHISFLVPPPPVKMAQQQKSGKPWSGTNRIPNIKEFVSNLDKDKAQRDQEIDQKNQPASQQQTGVTAHRNEARSTGGKTVTDPVTGKQVVIEDVSKRYMDNVDNPMVSSLPQPTYTC